MKKVIVFFFFLSSIPLFGMTAGLGMYDAILAQLNLYIASKKTIPQNLSPNLRNTYLGFINRSNSLRQKYASLANQLKEISRPAIQKTLSKRLDDVAINQGYGYKYANLVELKTPCDLITRQALSYTIAVPTFAGIASQNIQNFFKKNASFDIAQQWQTIIQTYFPNPAKQHKTLADKQYPDGFLQACTQLKSNIQNAFNQIAQKNNLYFSFNNAFGIDGMDQVIADIATKNERLMVRSTGKEDTKALANAGGNESISNVEAIPSQILPAIGNVIASYFGNKSLIQRLSAGDTSLFDPVPLTPVLIQRMIGERDPKKLPKCGVMFTEETEGGISNLNLKNSEGSIETTGISVIQSAYGHNEGVVNSLIPVDTFYVDELKNIYPVIRPKTYRMSPTATSGELELKKNEGPIVRQPSLSPDAIYVLKRFAYALEGYYQGPMDVEFVVNESEKIIYVVQARPIVHNPDLPQPSYIIDPDKILESQKINGSAIGVAGGALHSCNNKDQLVVASTIGEALLEYQDLEGQSARVECIIVGKMAPTTSHEATMFRGDTKPVIYTQQWQEVKQLLEKPSVNLVISPQQGLIVDWQQNGSVASLIEQGIAAQGWINYPVPPLMSVFEAPQLLTDESIKEFLPEHIPFEIFKQRLQEEKAKPSWKEYIKKLKIGTSKDASVMLATLLYEIREAIEQKSIGMELDEDLKTRITLLQKCLLYCAQQIKKNLNYAPTDHQYTKRLLPIRFLESLLYQQPTAHEIVDGYSVATLIARELAVEQKITQKLTQKQIPADPLTVQYLKINDVALTSELEKNWTNFITLLAKQADNHTKDNFRQLILNLGNLDMLPIWINTSFAQVYKQNLLPADLARTLIEEYTSQSKFLNQLSEKKTIIDALNVEAFSDPKKFATQWKNFNVSLLEYFIDPVGTNFIAAFEKANNLGRLAALQVMAKLVDTFDTSIKALKGSTQYKLEEKLTHFKDMLAGYAQLFKSWITLVSEGLIEYNSKSPLSHYISYIDDILSRQSLSKESFQATPGFNVSAFTIGSAVALKGGYPPLQQPETLEDVFTMIHQCLLVALSTLSTQAGIKNIILPPFMQKLTDNIMRLSTNKEKMSLISISLDKKLTKFLYNLPLRSHSMQLELDYKKNDPTAAITLRFFGANEEKRWDKIVLITKLLSGINFLNIKVKEAVILENGLTLNIAFNTDANMSELFTFIQSILQYSFDLDSQFILFYLNLLYESREIIFAKKLCSVPLLFNTLIDGKYIMTPAQILEPMYDVLRSENSSDDDKKSAIFIMRRLRGLKNALEPSRVLEIIHNLIKKNKDDSIIIGLYGILLQKALNEIKSKNNTIKQSGNNLLITLLSELQSFIEQKQDQIPINIFDTAWLIVMSAVGSEDNIIKQSGNKLLILILSKLELLIENDQGKASFDTSYEILRLAIDFLNAAIEDSGQKDTQINGLRLLETICKYKLLRKVIIKSRLIYKISNLGKSNKIPEDIKPKITEIMENLNQLHKERSEKVRKKFEHALAKMRSSSTH